MKHWLYITITLFSIACAHAQDHNAYLQKADTLFRKKQYTQSFELYQALIKQNKYTPAMLLKMAYIQEGMGHLSQSLYYLTLYYKVSHDERVLAKIEEVAANNKLEGYAETPSGKVFGLLDRYYALIAGVVMAAIVLLLTVAWTWKRKRRPVAAFIGVAGVLILVLLVHINFSTAPRQGIVANGYTYLMTGPSAGAQVTAIVGEGHQLEILGKKDVWVRVKWLGKEAFVKEGSLLKENL